MLDAGYWILDAGYRLFGSGFKVQSYLVGVLECWMLDAGRWCVESLIVPPVRPVRLPVWTTPDRCLARLVESRRAFKGWLTPLNRLIVELFNCLNPMKY